MPRPKIRVLETSHTPPTNDAVSDAGVAVHRHQALRKINNFHSVMAILAGLCMAAVSRLRFTIKDLPSKLVTVRATAALAALTYRCPNVADVGL